MSDRYRLAFAGLCALSLAACARPEPASDTVCSALAAPRSIVGENAPNYLRAHEAARICVRRNAYEMAASRDPAGDVAAAAVAACTDDIRTYAVLSAHMLNEVRADPSLTPFTPPSQIERTARGDLRDEALAAAMRARAGHCHR
jgi:hypothetical protein